MKNPLVDVAAILICLLAVVIGGQYLGQYFINQKRENSLKSVEKRVELKIDKKSFESAVKITE